MSQVQILATLIQGSASLSDDDKSLLLDSLDRLSFEESQTLIETLSNERDEKDQIESIYSDQRQSLFTRYTEVIKTIRRWAFHKGEDAERQEELKKINSLI